MSATKPIQIPKTMRACVFEDVNKFELKEKPVPQPSSNEALVKIRTTTICGTDVHIVKGDYKVKKGLTLGHEAVGTIVALGENAAKEGLYVGQRVVVPAMTPCGTCFDCLGGQNSQCGSKQMGSWKLGNTIDGALADYMLVPDAAANLAPVPETVTDEQAVLCSDILSTGFSAAEHADIKIGDIVAIFAQGPIGLCATAGCKLKGATQIIVVDNNHDRLETSKKMGADITINFKEVDPLAQIKKLTHGRGVDVAIECLGTQVTFENCLRALKPGGTLSSVGVYGKDITIPTDAWGAGLAGIKIVSTLCPGGKDRMRRLLSTIESGKVHVTPLITHRFKLDDVHKAYELFSKQMDGVIKVAITP